MYAYNHHATMPNRAQFLHKIEFAMNWSGSDEVSVYAEDCEREGCRSVEKSWNCNLRQLSFLQLVIANWVYVPSCWEIRLLIKQFAVESLMSPGFMAFVIVLLGLIALTSSPVPVRGELCGAATGAGDGDRTAALQNKAFATFRFKCRPRLKCQPDVNSRK